MIKVIVISDITIYREGLSQVLSGVGSILVTGSCGNVQTALAEIMNNAPDVVLLDMTMEHSRQLAQTICCEQPTTKVVALAVPYNESNIVGCAEAGITGYVPREASLTDVIEAVIGAAKGECYCPPRIAAYIVKKIQHFSSAAKRKYLISHTESPPQIHENKPVVYDTLTRRERQIATLLTDGLSNKQIARDLSIEVSTVKNHVHSLLLKLDVKSRTQAVSVLQQLLSRQRTGSLDLDPGLKVST